MNKVVFIFFAAVLTVSTQVSASGNAEAGKAKSTACAACHGVDGNSATAMFPKLAGQHKDYLFHSLKAYKSGKRKNPIMSGQAQSLTETDMADLAAFFSKQKGLNIKY
ncbi:MAG: cytochrome c [Thiobacillaceae bacterium]